MNWSKSATRNNAPTVAMIPTMMTSSGISSLQRPVSAGFTEKKLKSMNAVAFVGPKIVCREPAKSGATKAATAVLMIP